MFLTEYLAVGYSEEFINLSDNENEVCGTV